MQNKALKNDTFQLSFIINAEKLYLLAKAFTMRFPKIVFLLIILVLQSCISRKELVYLQKGQGQANAATEVQQKAAPYKVQVNDILYINIKSTDPELVAIFNTNIGENQNLQGGALYFNGYNVNVHGNIRIPILGEVNVLGYNVEEIRQIIEKKLLTEYLQPSANLFITVKLAGFNYSVLGEVGAPGNNVLFQERVNVLEAIANAGDITVTGDRKDVLIIRQYPDKQRIHHIDLTKEDILVSPYYYLMPNDMVYVKPLKQKTWGTGTNGFQTFTTVFSVISVIASTVLLINNL